MRTLTYACILFGAGFSLWALSNILAWLLVPSWHTTREPLISAFVLLIPATPCLLVAPVLATLNRSQWPRHVVVASWVSFVAGCATLVLFWLADHSST
jgi:hypothetical protein